MTKRTECLDKFCEGDVEPKRDVTTEVALKLNGQWYVGPKQYFSSGTNGALFYWPSKTPGYSGKDFPEKGAPFADVAIEIFLRSNNVPIQPYGYGLIEVAEINRWIASRVTLRPGLEVVKMKHIKDAGGDAIDHVIYYVATERKEPDGLPPVATCNHDHPSNSGGTGFIWQPGVWAGVRMNQKHCVDWPEIYPEIRRVLQLLRKS